MLQWCDALFTAPHISLTIHWLNWMIFWKFVKSKWSDFVHSTSFPNRREFTAPLLFEFFWYFFEAVSIFVFGGVVVSQLSPSSQCHKGYCGHNEPDHLPFLFLSPSPPPPSLSLSLALSSLFGTCNRHSAQSFPLCRSIPLRALITSFGFCKRARSFTVSH